MKATGVGVFADHPAVDGLIALGRRKGHLSFEDLRTGLPIADMSAAAIAAAVSRLEHAGILIEVEDEPVEFGTEPPASDRQEAVTEVRRQAPPYVAGVAAAANSRLPSPSRRLRAGVAGLAGLAALSVAMAAGLLLL